MFKRGLVREHAELLSFVVRSADFLLVLCAGVAAQLLRFGHLSFYPNYKIALFVGAVLTVFIFSGMGVYRSWRGHGWWRRMGLVTIAWITVMAILVIAAFVSKTGEDFSRIWVGTWFLMNWVMLIGARVVLELVLRYLRRKHWNAKRIAIMGAGVLGRNVEAALRGVEWTGFDVVAFADDSPTLQGTQVAGLPVYRVEQELVPKVEARQIDEVWIALPLRADHRVMEIQNSLRFYPITIRFVPDIFGFQLMSHSMMEVAGIPVVDLNGSPMTGANRLVKALEDRVLAFVILVLAFPLLLMIAVGIKLGSKGPVLFKQKRDGWDGRVIKVYKFRSMYVHKEPDGQVTQARKNDSRVTPFGSFLRRTSLDELPQFFNVLQGRMSIVGPRPHALAHNELYKTKVRNYMQRHKVKPGITGWAQINGLRGETDSLEKMQLRVEYDLFYIENWSVWFDLKIIFLTLFKGFKHQNAY